MGIIDIEGPKQGATEVDAQTQCLSKMREMTRNPYLLVVFGLGLLAGIKWWTTGKILNADNLVEEGFGADFESKHFWK